MRAAATEAENLSGLLAGRVGEGSWTALGGPEQKSEPPQGPREGGWGLTDSPLPRSLMAVPPAGWQGSQQYHM